MENGDIFDGKRIGELVGSIINKFSEEKLNCAEAMVSNKKKQKQEEVEKAG